MKPNHRMVPNGSIRFNDSTEVRSAKQVSEYIRRGSLPESYYKKRKTSKLSQKIKTASLWIRHLMQSLRS
jgi:hypothetical protein